MNKLCQRVNNAKLIEQDWGEVLYHYLATVSSTDTANMLRFEGRIARNLQDGALTLQEVKWSSGSGFGLVKDRFWLEMGGSQTALSKPAWESHEEITKQQFFQAMRRFCSVKQ